MEMRAVAGKMPLFVTDMLRLAFLPCTPTSRAGSHVPEMSRPPCNATKACVHLHSWSNFAVNRRDTSAFVHTGCSGQGQACIWRNMHK